MIKSDIRRISILLPIVCLIFGLAVAYSQYRRLQALEKDRDAVQGKITRLQQTLRASTGDAPYEKLATYPATTSEEPSFLNRLKQLAAESGVQILRWSSTRKLAGTTPGAQPTEQPPALRDITEITSKLEVAGPYNSVRAFTVRVLDSPRLLTISDVTWGRDTQLGTKLSMNLSRYVAPPTAEETQGSTAAFNGAPAGGSK
jgi:Tfp pilus assembly protein PilO